MRPRSDPNGSGVKTGRAVVLIAVLLIVGWLVLKPGGKSPVAAGGSQGTSHHSTTTTLPAATTTTTTVPVVPPSQVKVQVLNGVGHGSLAGAWSTKLKTLYGYETLAPDNATAIVSQSVIYIVTPGYQAEASALAAHLSLSSTAIDSTIPPPASAPVPATERSIANLILVIGPDLANSA
jgi:hypothetical protein